MELYNDLILVTPCGGGAGSVIGGGDVEEVLIASSLSQAS